MGCSREPEYAHPTRHDNEASLDGEVREALPVRFMAGRRKALSFVAAALLLAACRNGSAESRSDGREGGASNAEPAPVGDAGAAKTVRVVSLSPSTTESLFAVGAGHSLVGRSRYCNWPPEVTNLPQVGGYIDPSLEAILELRPSLVTGARGPAGRTLTDKLEARGIATYFPPTESFAQIDDMILGLGARTGNAERARNEVDALHARVHGIEEAVAKAPRKRVLLVFGLQPVSVAGPESFADEMVRRAGGTNVVTEGGAYPSLGMERVLTLDPDVILNAIMGEAPGNERIAPDAPGWNKVRAVVEGHVVAVRDESVLRPGPRIGEGLAALAHAIHPDIAIPETKKP